MGRGGSPRRGGGFGGGWGGTPRQPPPPRPKQPPPPPPLPRREPGLFKQMAATAGGVALGSAVESRKTLTPDKPRRRGPSYSPHTVPAPPRRLGPQCTPQAPPSDMFWPVFSILFVTVISVAACNNIDPISITVFYETLCPDSIKFINEKLIPAYTQSNFNFENLLANLTLVPYGHVRVNDASKYQYTCQHGRSECEGNKLHGCAVKYFTDKKQLLQYIGCLLDTSNHRSQYSSYPTNKCQDKIPKEVVSKLINCYNTNEGWDLFNQNGVATDTTLGTNFFIPFITFYNVKDDKISDNAYNDLRSTLCSRYGIRDYACSDYSSY